MSKINAVRLINVNYNNNAIRVSDEVFHLCGDSTLLSLRNGGGKSVLVQMMTAPFVHKRYRDAKDRSFESYFTTNKPSFILVEWVLDQGAGYVLTGMMVRRNQENEEASTENLEMIHIISEYKEPCLGDIHHLPVVEKGKKEIMLKNFSSCRQIFEAYKRDPSMKFFYYDMGNAAQSRQYFDKLLEYQINYKEWETIIKKVNLKESGLSDLFSDCRDEKGLLEKWFLDAVESKLNKERNRMKEFQTILEKYVGQYKDNQSKIKRRDIIRLFKEEALRIQEKAKCYQSIIMQERAKENQVAHLIAELTRLRELTEVEQGQISGQINKIALDIARVEYEKLSGEIHHLEEERNFHISNREMIAMEQDNLEQDAKEMEKKLALFAMTKQQEFTSREQTELEVMRQKLQISRKKDENLEPERRKLGHALRCYYQREIETNLEQTKENRTKFHEVSSNISTEKEKIVLLEQKIRDAASREGGLESNVESYSQQEEHYNNRYEEQLVRNILGEYEPGIMEIQTDTYARKLESQIRERLGKKKQLEGSREKQKQMERSLADLREKQILSKTKMEQQQKIKEDYKRELEERKVILKYLNMEEKALFHTEEILHESNRKLMETAGIRRNLEKEEDSLQKEYQHLTKGKVLELPEDLEKELTNLGIHIIYGMEWLKKNDHTEKQNQELVKKHPFLPYALILSQAELNKLSRHAGEISTSFPIPIILRENLESEAQKEKGGVIQLPGVCFYVLFNENLLNEEKLRLLVSEKENQIRKKQEAIEIRQSEYKEYFERQERIKNQAVSKDRFDKNEESVEELRRLDEELGMNMRESIQELSELKRIMEELETDIREADKQISLQERKIEDFTQLCKDYTMYIQYRRELERCQKEAARLKENQKRSQIQLEKMQEVQYSLETQKASLEQERQKIQGQLKHYQSYEEKEVEPKDMSVAEMEARYAAITSTMSLEIQELEEQEQRCQKRFEEAVEELEHLRQKFCLDSKDWLGLSYNRSEEVHQETLLEDRRKKIEVKRMLWNEEDKQVAVIIKQVEDRIKRMYSECKEKEPLPKSEIQNQDFDARKNQLIYQEKEAKTQFDQLQKHLQSYDENLTALSEYSEFKQQEPVVWEQDLSVMNSKELRNYKGILIRDYNQKVREGQEAKDQIVRVLNQIVRMDAFQEDFYRKPLETMLELTENADQLLLQLSTTMQSYENLMEKLEVDISLVEKEKNKIVELLEEYVREVHQNLGKIDSNATITVRERPIKMLKIQLPDWEENENLYHIRLQDAIDEITQKGIQIFECNENAQEFFGTRMTTRNLYDTVIGIGNVQIRLYKIEEQREYPITWAEVAKNSGGEGFLSAFVVLSSLLHYMRKDDTDIFADRNEGKVLLMDNPFAQTNAAHLLKPLMDMAKKTNTQLICLTGLGGESIYNRFDNIYVLNLISASLRNGMQYLKADHLRGNEPETMVVSQIQVMEQQELVF